MKFFIDTAEVSVIRALIPTGLVDGVTTNPSLVAKSGRDFRDMIAEVCALVRGPVSAEETAVETDQMLAEGRSLAKIAGNVVVKLPLTLKGVAACKALTGEGIRTNVTLCFSVNQALIAAKAGATYISPFVGRLDDVGQDGMELIREIRLVYDNYGFATEILAASIRSPQHIREAAIAGADVATAPPAIIKALAHHPLTDKGLEAFLADWTKTGQKIL